MDRENEYQNIKPLPYFGINKLLPYLKPYRAMLLSIVIIGLLSSISLLFFPLFQRYAIDVFIGLGNLQSLGGFIAVYIPILIFQVAADAVSAYHASQVEIYVSRDMRRAGFNHLQSLSFSFFNQNSVGYIHARVMSDTARIAGVVSWSLLDCVWHLTDIVGAIVVMLSIDWKLTLWVIAIVPFTVAAAGFFQKKLTALHRRIRESNSRISAGFNEGIIGAKTTKTLVAEQKLEEDFDKETQEMKTAGVRTARVSGAFSAVISLSASLAVAFVLWRGGLVTQEGVFELGTLSAFISYAQGMMEPLHWLIEACVSLINAQVNIERFTGLMQTKSDVTDTKEVIEKYGDAFSPKYENWEPLFGEVEFRDVTFKYPGDDEYILENFNLKVPQGTNVAIVGETGAGKSTLINLICRFFEPTKGAVLIDGRDARERSQLWLHSNIGYVLQTPHLFSGSVLDNLKYGNPDASQEQIEQAVRNANAQDIISRMENGYDSDVGEGGGLLSTGEKQLLSFARAILADPRIFVLDEATSSVDTVTEQKIQNAIEHLMKGRTSFIVAHRLSTIRKADVILVVKDGKIAERGNHKDLLAKKGYYYQLYTRQFNEESVKEALNARPSPSRL